MRTLLPLLLAIAVSPAMALTPMPLVGTTWAWYPAAGDGPVPVHDRYTLELRPDKSLVVQADCNRGKGGYRHEDDQLAIGPLAVTKKGCPPPSRGAEFAGRLSAVDGFRYEGIELVLTSTSGARELRMRPLAR